MHEVVVEAQLKSVSSEHASIMAQPAYMYVVVLLIEVLRRLAVAATSSAVASRPKRW